MKRARKRWRAVTALLLFGYVGSYLYLSLHGRFEPAWIGANYVKAYDWAPRGFVENYKWSRPRQYIYLPLYLIDIHYWHESRDAHGGKYPVHVPDSVDEVYAAWQR